MKEMRKTYRILVRNPLQKQPLGRPRQKDEDNVL
jgi:hypothetical protein